MESKQEQQQQEQEQQQTQIQENIQSDNLNQKNTEQQIEETKPEEFADLENKYLEINKNKVLLDSEKIRGNEYLVIQDNRKDSRIVNLKNDRHIHWRKCKIDLKSLIGKPYNTVFEVTKNKLIELEEGQYEFYNYEKGGGEELQDLMEQEQKDNRDMISTQHNLEDKKDFQHQSMTAEEIIEIKHTEGVSKKDLIEQIVSSNAQIDQRTAFSKKKYINRKKFRHLFLITVQKCKLENLVNSLYNGQEKQKDVGYFRQDSMAFFLYGANVVKDSKILMFDSTRGLGLAGISSRLNGNGMIHLGHSPVLDVQQKRNLSQYFNYINPTQEMRKALQLVSTNELMEQTEQIYTHLIISGLVDCIEILNLVGHRLMIGGQLCIYSPIIENLTPVYEFMVNSKQFLACQISDTFLRTYQVLKGRTHPLVENTTFSGYVLIGTKTEIRG